jgi:hypothetical protein
MIAAIDKNTAKYPKLSAEYNLVNKGRNRTGNMLENTFPLTNAIKLILKLEFEVTSAVFE